MKRLVLGTRGSALALWQAGHIAERLRGLHPGLEIEQRIIKTEGDVQQTAPLGVGDRGVFVRRIERALLDGQIDFAVHSLKDLPTEQPAGLAVTAVPERHDPRDALVTREGLSFEELPAGTVLGTGSFRRRAQLLAARGDLEIVPLRGNVDTRVRRVVEGRMDGVILALAGLQRLGLEAAPYRPIDPEICLPAVGQGALGVEARESAGEVRELLAPLDHPPTHGAVTAERAFLRRLGGGCLAPATAFARIDGSRVRLDAVVGDPDGKRLLRDREEGGLDAPAGLGERLAERLLSAGAGDLLEQARDECGP